MVDAIKSTVPPGSRRWVPQHKHWTVSPLWADELAEVLRQSGCRVIGLQVQQQLDERAVSLFQAVGPDRVPAVHRALSGVLHPDKSTGSAELQQQLNDGRRQVEERRQDMPTSKPQPGIGYMGGEGPDSEFLLAAATEIDLSFSRFTGLPLAEVVRLNRRGDTRALNAAVRNARQAGEERRGISGYAARRQVELVKEPDSTLTRSGKDAQALTAAMEFPPGESRRRGWREAAALTAEAYRPGHVRF